MNNLPVVKLGVVAVSRGNFSRALTEGRRAALLAAFRELYPQRDDVYECPIVVGRETDIKPALDDLAAHGVNALAIFLGNFGPETPETLLAGAFGGPVLFLAAAEESRDKLITGRGDAFCGLLNASYNLGIRGIRAHLPKCPVGTARQLAAELARFAPVARVVLGAASLKIITFGPRPDDFVACNAPISPLYRLGVEIEENSELDLLLAYRRHEGDERIPSVVAEMAADLGSGNTMPDLLPKLAQYELTLLDWMEEHKGSRRYVAFANKCWPAFEDAFGFVPCYVNAHLASKGIPVACEVDVYGALSEYLAQCASGDVVTLLDLNNTVPQDLFDDAIRGGAYTEADVFMGFHCGNTASCRLKNPQMKHQLIMFNDLAPGQPDHTNGTIEGDIVAGPITLFRLQGTADCRLRAYAAEGEVLDVPTHSFGSIGVIGIKEMHRFYRYVLLQGRYPHHTAVAFGKAGRVLFDALCYLGVEHISYNQPASLPYPGENPFSD